MTARKPCPVCAAERPRLFLRRPSVPVNQHIVMHDEEEARHAPRGMLDLVVCDRCGFIFNQAFDSSLIAYDERYNNAQSFSPLFDDYVSALARFLIEEKGVRNSRIIEVGCGNGLFLRRLVMMDAGNSGYGFDTSYTGPDTDLDGRLRFERRFYGPECAHLPADVVVCRHVIEHVPDPVDLLRAVRQALAHSPHARVFFETPDVTWILRNHVIWDFFYEHCSLFTPDSLTTAFERGGFLVEDVHPVFGDQYQWLEATVAHDPCPIHLRPGLIPALADEFAVSEVALRQEWETRIRDLARSGPVALWGAGAKGVTLANLIDRERQWIDCLVDLNPAKQGGYLPGTAHPIIDYRKLAERSVTTAVVMNPNYHEEIAALLRDAGIVCRLVV
ncbi:MAG: class I SAM-dependent methyltransferase [Thermomicrobiales bacterium]